MRLSIQSQEGGLARVAVLGEVAYDELSGRPDPLPELLGSDCYRGKVLLDLQHVDMLDSTGICWLLTCRKHFHEDGGKFVLHSPSEIAHGVLKVLNLGLVIPIAEDEEAALEIVNRGD
jgi:anti-anti-sigma factor